MDNSDFVNLRKLDVDRNFWMDFYSVYSLVLIGSREENGDYNLAPKHMAMPLGLENYFGFIGTPRKSTYRNVEREGVFTVSYPRPTQLVMSSLTASQREEDNTKPIIDLLPTVPAAKIDGEFLEDSYLKLECELVEITGNFGEWKLMAGEVVAAYAHKEIIRSEGKDDNDLIHDAPLIGYLHPNRFTVIDESQAFPLPKNFKR